MTTEIKVLLIEDLQMAQEIAVTIFNELNCVVTLAANGKQALDQILFEKFDLIFLDIVLPDMSGFEVAQIVRHLERNNKCVPIIAVTAHFDDDFAARSRAAGITNYLCKPLSVESVRNMISNYLNTKAGAIEDVVNTYL